MLPPPAHTKPYTPIARARSPGSVNRFMISDSDTADTTAPPSPCTARAAISIVCDGASPHASDASVNTTRPARNMRRWPYRSPSRPPSSRQPPNVSRYALTTQTSAVSVKCRSVPIDGSATFTIVLSSTIISTPRQRTISAYQRFSPWMPCVMGSQPSDRDLKGWIVDGIRTRLLPVYGSSIA